METVFIVIPEVLKPEHLARAQHLLATADWGGSRGTAGRSSARTNGNRRLSENSPAAHTVGAMILEGLEKSLLFGAAVQPVKVFQPRFNRQEVSTLSGAESDNAIRRLTAAPHRARADLSATLFLTEPDEYEGGELVVEDTYGLRTVKLAAGHMVLYTAKSLHQVRPITRGARIISIFWIQTKAHTRVGAAPVARPENRSVQR